MTKGVENEDEEQNEREEEEEEAEEEAKGGQQITTGLKHVRGAAPILSRPVHPPCDG